MVFYNLNSYTYDLERLYAPFLPTYLLTLLPISLQLSPVAPVLKRYTEHYNTNEICQQCYGLPALATFFILTHHIILLCLT